MSDTSEPGATHAALVAAGWQLLDPGDFSEIVGRIYSRTGEGTPRFGFIAEDRHKNRRRVLHGGVLAAFADRALALAGRTVTGGQPQATIELSIRFVDAVQIGEFVELDAEIVRKTRSVIFVRGTLLAGGRIVATTDGIWKLLTPRPAS